MNHIIYRLLYYSALFLVSMLLPHESKSFGQTNLQTAAINSPSAIEQVIQTTNGFGGVAPLPETNRQLAAGEAPEVYTVEAGDTLFDICDQLLDEGDYWPMLWALNPYIKNPHFIWPGMRLRFYPGDDEAPPFLAIVEEADLIPVDKGTVSIDKIIEQTIELDVNLPKIIPAEIVNIDDIEANDDLFLVVGSILSESNVKLTLPGFVLNKQVEPICQIIAGASGEAVIMEGLEFVCEPQMDSVELDRSLTVLRLSEEIEDEESGDVIGYRYQFIAHVKLTQVLESGSIVMGLATKSRLGIEKDDLIVDYRSTRRSVSLDKQKGSTAPSQGKIISFDREGVEFGGEGDMVYLNRGEQNGIEKGQVYQIRQFMHSLVFNDIIDDYPSQTLHVGNVRIIDTTDVGSVGYITENFQEVSLGDVFGL